MVGISIIQNLQNADLTFSVLKILTLGAISFIVAILATPFLTHFLYKYKLWKKTGREKSIDGKEMPVFKKFHSDQEVKTPRLGGILIWTIPPILAVVFFLLTEFNGTFIQKLNFLSRSQTWLPLFAMVAASIVGLVDDLLQVRGKGKYIGGGLSLKYRLGSVFLIGLIGGWWFYSKLGWISLHIPGNGELLIGAWYIPFFVFVMMAVYAGGVIDGIDGLAGSSFSTIFGAYAIIALFRGQIDVAAFCAVVAGALLAFLWFNIPPARFYMGESGTMGLCTALTVVAFLTDSVLVLPIIGLLLVAEAGSVILQQLSKKFLKRKIFLAAPLHYHFEAKGWPHYKITMRFWVIGLIAAIIGVAIRLLG
ncbi:phospho-N-acetylmuramoyl-pentapeptide-transferase [Patescibacteria group bacterium]|nr:phospho-N-acetylmuramoyl-pentapeptide-transferase [Patescibacteria group bacterium]MBU4162164.1 phospho-N-acetylmuramoyl-pentapeptide-transferase [Patescibacteria group bacterium]